MKDISPIDGYTIYYDDNNLQVRNFNDAMDLLEEVCKFSVCDNCPAKVLCKKIKYLDWVESWQDFKIKEKK